MLDVAPIMSYDLATSQKPDAESNVHVPDDNDQLGGQSLHELSVYASHLRGPHTSEQKRAA